MNRRKMILGGAAVGAAAAGVGAAWWQGRGDLPLVGPGAGAGADAGSQSLAQPGRSGQDPDPIRDFWAMSFDSPDGQSLAMSSLRGKPLLLNFWATWCPPCIEELPLLDSFYRANRATGWQVLGLAVDQPSAVRQWLQRKPLAFPVGMAGFQGTDLGKSLGNASGGLPFTVVFGAGGGVLARKTGKVTPDELQQWASLS